MGEENRYLNLARYANFAFSFGTTMAASLLLGYLGGNWLDKKLGTPPIFLLVGVLSGVALSFYSLFHELSALGKPVKYGKGGKKDE